MRILFCDTSFAPGREALERLLPDDQVRCCPRAEIALHIPEADVAVPLMSRLDGDLIAKGRNLKLIQQFGVGLEGVDMAAARSRGIPVANVPSSETGNSVSVAEWAVFLMLALARRYPEAVGAFRGRSLGEPVGTVLHGKRAGLIGVGNLGTAIAERLRALGVEVWGIRRRPGAGGPDALAFLGGPGDLPRVLGAADFVILAVPLTPETRGLIGRREIGLMKPGAYLVNVGRGPVIDYDALLDGLRRGAIAGAGLDVFWTEPPDPDDPLFRYNVIPSPHIGGATDYSFGQIARAVADNIERLRQGKPLRNRAC